MRGAKVWKKQETQGSCRLKCSFYPSQSTWTTVQLYCIDSFEEAVQRGCTNDLSLKALLPRFYHKMTNKLRYLHGIKEQCYQHGIVQSCKEECFSHYRNQGTKLWQRPLCGVQRTSVIHRFGEANL